MINKTTMKINRPTTTQIKTNPKFAHISKAIQQMLERNEEFFERMCDEAITDYYYINYMN